MHQNQNKSWFFNYFFIFHILYLKRLKWKFANSPRFKSWECCRKIGKNAKKIKEILRVKHVLRSVRWLWLVQFQTLGRGRVYIFPRAFFVVIIYLSRQINEAIFLNKNVKHIVRTYINELFCIKYQIV